MPLPGLRIGGRITEGHYGAGVLTIVTQPHAQSQPGTDHLRDWLTAITAAVALIALCISVANYYQGRRRDKRDLFISVHQELIKPEAAEGRQVLYGIKDADKAVGIAKKEYESGRIYTALAVFDLLALYVESKWIDYETVRREWYYSLVHTRYGANMWIAERYKDREQWHSWEHYQRLSKRLEADGPVQTRQSLEGH